MKKYLKRIEGNSLFLDYFHIKNKFLQIHKKYFFIKLQKNKL